MTKRTALLFMILMLIFSPISDAIPALFSEHDHNALDNGQYVGDMSNYLFHLAFCKLVPKIKPANRLFFNTRDEAIDAGYFPCTVCKP